MMNFEKEMLSIAVILMLAVLVYAWIVFPMLVVALRRRVAPRAAGVGDVKPSVVVFLSAHDEARTIGARLENLAALDYPRERLLVYMGDDGSRDMTAGIARTWADAHPGSKVFRRDRCCGKIAMLKYLVAQYNSDFPRVPGTAGGSGGAGLAEIFVFTDANTLFAPDALRRLVEPLADSQVGGICGRLVFRSADGTETDEGAYWRWETRLKTAESVLDSCLGANGAIYALRRELFWQAIPDNTIVDDFVIGLKVREQGCRFLYEPAAVAYEDLPPTVADEWRRRARIGSGAFQALWLCRRCLHPRYGLFAWMFWSHKVLRWFTPHLLLLLLIGAILHVGYCWMTCHSRPWPASGVLLMTGAGLAVVALGWMLRARRGLLARLTRPVYYFFAMQAAIFVGFLRFCRGGLVGAWDRTER